MFLKLAVVLVLVVAFSVSQNEKCCMPLTHTVNATFVKTSLENGALQETRVSERHYLDLPGKRYRLDLDTYVNNQEFFSGTHLGFVDLDANETTEYLIKGLDCQCSRTKGLSYIYKRSCVGRDFRLTSVVQVGYGASAITANVFESQLGILKQRMIVQPLEDPSECVILNWDIESTWYTNKGILAQNATRLVAFNFKHNVEDSDYEIPSFCNKC